MDFTCDVSLLLCLVKETGLGVWEQDAEENCLDLIWMKWEEDGDNYITMNSIICTLLSLLSPYEKQQLCDGQGV
jgi:hypothetical protein